MKFRLMRISIKKKKNERKPFELKVCACTRVWLKGQPNIVIYELRENFISDRLLHFVTSDKRAGHQLLTFPK